MKSQVSNRALVHLDHKGFDAYVTPVGVIAVEREWTPPDPAAEPPRPGGHVVVSDFDESRARYWLYFDRRGGGRYPPGHLEMLESSEQLPAIPAVVTARLATDERFRSDDLRTAASSRYGVRRLAPDVDRYLRSERRKELRGVISVFLVSVIGIVWLGGDLLGDDSDPLDRGVRDVEYWGFVFVVVFPVAMLLVIRFLIKEDEVSPVARVLTLLSLASLVGLVLLLGLDEGRTRFGWNVYAAGSDDMTSATTSQTTEAGIRAVFGIVPLLDVNALGWENPIERGSIPFGAVVWATRLMIVFVAVYPLRRLVTALRPGSGAPASRST